MRSVEIEFEEIFAQLMSNRFSQTEDEREKVRLESKSRRSGILRKLFG